MRIGDDLFLGPEAVFGPNPTGDNNPSPMANGVGPAGRTLVYDIVPLTLQAAGLAASQNPGSGVSFTLVAGTGVTSRLRSDGTTEYVLDVPRCVTLTAAGANTATYRVTGYDAFGQLMTSTLAAPSTSTVATTKAFKTVTSITNLNATAGTNGITAGFNDKFGLPVAVLDAGYVANVKWNNTLAADAGTLVNADTTSPATSTTNDVRGCYTPSANASNGSRRLVVTIALSAANVGPLANRIGAFGVTQA
jgi:hypothetical protein